MGRRARERSREIVLQRAAEKPQFREALLRDPRSAIKDEFGMDLPAEISLHAVEETDRDVYFVLPALPPSRDATVTLREITGDNLRDVLNLEVSEAQKEFVAPNAVSVAEAHFSPNAWFRAIYADETPVGFVMLSDDPEKRHYYLWRYMVAAEYQGLGFGRQALEQVIEYVRTRPGATELLLSFVPGEGSPRDFYARLGFQETGKQHGPELEMRLAL